MPHQVDKVVGERIRMRRRTLKMSQSELADEVGVKFQQLQKYEKADNRVSASRLFDIAAALDVGIDYFFKGLDGQKDDMLIPQTAEELELLTLFRRNSLDTQNALLRLMKVIPGAKS